jgi:hypothetical protein
VAAPFISAKIFGKRLVPHPTTIKQVPITDVEMKMFARRWLPTFLNQCQQQMSQKIERRVSGNLEAEA